MKITVNGETRDVQARALQAVLEELGYGDAKVATAVNETFVPSAARPATTLAEGDRLAGVLSLSDLMAQVRVIQEIGSPDGQSRQVRPRP